MAGRVPRTPESGDVNACSGVVTADHFIDSISLSLLSVSPVFVCSSTFFLTILNVINFYFYRYAIRLLLIRFYCLCLLLHSVFLFSYSFFFILGFLLFCGWELLHAVRPIFVSTNKYLVFNISILKLYTLIISMFELIIYWQKPLFILQQIYFLWISDKNQGKKETAKSRKTIKKSCTENISFLRRSYRDRSM